MLVLGERQYSHVHLPSMVGSYSSTKWLWINWIVKADFPTPEEDNVRLNWKDDNRDANLHRLRRPVCILLRTEPTWIISSEARILSVKFASTLAAIDKTLNKEEEREGAGVKHKVP